VISPRTLILLVLLVLPACSDDRRARYGQAPATVNRDVLSVYNVLQTNYLYPDKIPKDPSAFATVTDLLNALNDPFTFELTPPQAARSTTGTVQGDFGFSIARLTTFVYVNTIDPSGPSFQAGLRRNDVVRTMNGLTITPTTTDAELVAAFAPSTMSITVTRGPTTTVTFNFARASFTSTSVEEQSVDATTHYVRIGHFVDTSIDPRGPTGELEKILQQNASKTRWILDLRWNSGGFLHRACEVSDFFATSGRIVTIRDRNGVVFFQCDATSGGTGEGKSLAVLQNGQSASSSELAAAALRALGGAKIVGEKSFGKGVSQRIFTYPDGGQLLVVGFELFDPNGASWHVTGITPDVTVPLDPQKLLDGRDSQLEAGLTAVGSPAAP
jgi:carboxyl-terminal processing protease